MLLNDMIWAKITLDYYARLEFMMINFGWNWFYVKMNLGLITWVLVRNYLSVAL
jgi:hypothetical protein